ncbi:MAG: hypothetical protein ACOH5I_00985 [Oligoflexus sp.]
MDLNRFLSSIAVFTLAVSCTSTPKKPVSDRPPQTKKVTSQDSKDTDEASSTRGDPNCHAFNPLVESIPHFFADVGVVVTDVMKPCTTDEGKAGYIKGSGWVAMGFPCTGGGGRIDWRGSFHTPNLVIFDIPNSCPMAPGQQQLAETLVKPRLGVGDDSRLMAFYPFGISYWELADGSDADTSYTVEVVTTGSRQKRWTGYRAGQAISIKLYGRPNSLMPSRYWYEVIADLMQESDEQFKLEVREVHVLDKAALDKVKQRCLALSPARNCRQAFP